MCYYLGQGCEIMLIILIIASILIVSFICYYIAFFSPHKGAGDHYNLPVGEQYEKHRERMLGYIDDFLKLDCEKIEIIAYDGKKLRGRYYHVNDDAGVDICFHGYRGTGIRDFCGGSRIAMAMGRNVILVDQRAHGESQGHSICFGIKERYDCLSWINYVLCRFGEDVDINIYGVSMGASTVLLASGLELPENVKHIVADSPYTSAGEIIKKVCGDMKIPASLAYPFIYIGALIFAGIRLDCCDCVSAVKNAKIPILIIHGEDDRFVPCRMSEKIQKANPKLIHRVTFPNAGHGISYIEDKDRYEQLIRQFISTL